MKSKKLLIAGGAAVAGCVLIYMGYKYVVKPVGEKTTDPTKTAVQNFTQLKLSDTWTRGTGADPVLSERLKSIIKQPVSGLGNAYILN